METLRRPRPTRPPVSIHMMPDFSAYGPNNNPLPLASAHALHSLKSLKRKRSESTDNSDDGEDRDREHISFGHFDYVQPLAETGYTPSKADQTRHTAKRARLADDFAGLKLRAQSLSPTSTTNPVSVSATLPFWPSLPAVKDEQRPSPPPTDEYDRLGAQVTPHRTQFDIDLDSVIDVLRGQVEEVLSPSVQAERSRNSSSTDGNEHDIRMHGTSSYEPDKHRIIITDLDDSSDSSDGESDNAPPTTTPPPFKISSAYLSRFGHITPRPEFSIEDLGDVDAGTDNKRALVAFRPLVRTIDATVPSQPEVVRAYIEEIEDGEIGSPTDMEDAGTTDADENGFVVEPYSSEDAMDLDME